MVLYDDIIQNVPQESRNEFERYLSQAKTMSKDELRRTVNKLKKDLEILEKQYQETGDEEIRERYYSLLEVIRELEDAIQKIDTKTGILVLSGLAGIGGLIAGGLTIAINRKNAKNVSKQISKSAKQVDVVVKQVAKSNKIDVKKLDTQVAKTLSKSKQSTKQLAMNIAKAVKSAGVKTKQGQEKITKLLIDKAIKPAKQSITNTIKKNIRFLNPTRVLKKLLFKRFGTAKIVARGEFTNKVRKDLQDAINLRIKGLSLKVKNKMTPSDVQQLIRELEAGKEIAKKTVKKDLKKMHKIIGLKDRGKIYTKAVIPKELERYIKIPKDQTELIHKYAKKPKALQMITIFKRTPTGKKVYTFGDYVDALKKAYEKRVNAIIDREFNLLTRELQYLSRKYADSPEILAHEVNKLIKTRIPKLTSKIGKEVNKITV